MEIKYKIGKIKTNYKSLEDKLMTKGVWLGKKCTNCTKNGALDRIAALKEYPVIA